MRIVPAVFRCWPLALVACLNAPLISSVRASPSVNVETTRDDAVRLADQAAFGPTVSVVQRIEAQGPAAWIDAQIATPASGYAPIAPITAVVKDGCPATLPVGNTCYRDNYSAFPLQLEFFRNAIRGPDQLRQRVALAYSQIFVISAVQVGPAYALRNYQQMLLNNAFVNFRQLLNDVALSPAMGHYLNMANNNKGNPAKGISPNENFAREVLQLFTIGPNTLNADGTPVLVKNEPVPSYTQDTIEGFASTFTGWTFPNASGSTSLPADNFTQWYTGPMITVAAEHDEGAKSLLTETLAPGQSAPTDLKEALDDIFDHPNVGPFIGRQMIQFLVTSNPSPAYVARVAATFDHDGKGIRGNMAAVIKAVLLDPEARAQAAQVEYGKLREPAVQIAAVLRALDAQSDGVYPAAIAASMGQPLFTANTVFSFYPPSYPLPGSKTLVGPQFGILNTATSLANLNFLTAVLYSPTGIAPNPTVPGATGTTIDLAAYEANAGDATKLVAQFDQNVLHDTLSATEAAAIETAVNAIPSSDTVGRARAAAYLVFASPRYQITR